LIERLLNTLAEVGKPAELVRMPDGSRVVLFPHGGRVLGLFAAGDGQNFYWTHPALESVETARALYAGNDWHNSGGDRTWLAPEIDIFFPRYPDLDMSTYWQPRQLDPGDYALMEEGGALRMVNRLSVTLSRTKQLIELVMSKWVGPAANPLRYETEFREAPEIRYAGYTQHTRLEILSEPRRGAQAGLWNLVQMQHGGELLIPTYSRSEPKLYMGSISPNELITTDQLVRYRMAAQGEHKIGLRAVGPTGRVGYLYQSGDEMSLIVRNFFVDPSSEYVDVPWTETGNLGFAVQACNVNSKWGRFSELEYHMPAIGYETGRRWYEDVSQIWAFRGPRETVRTIARRLLSPLI
jgi:hypothetical protein